MPKFESPPVVETALSVAFAPIDGLVGARVGSLWDDLRDDLPRIAERAPYEMPVERLTGPPPQPSVQLQLVPAPSKTRTWFISDDDQRLVQVQRDWFAFNWRKLGGPNYVGYEEGRANFEKYFETFLGFLERESLGTITATQCEVTYINHIPFDDGGSELPDVFSCVSSPSLAGPAARVEHWQSTMVVLLRDRDEPFGRLHVSIQPILREATWIWVLSLTARGTPIGNGSEGIMRFLDKGRQAVSLNFVELTTEAMHRKWGLSWS